MILGGIDGCKAGWLVITFEESGFNYKVLDNVELLKNLQKDAARFFIDMPIGLSSEGYPRTIEKTLRQELKNRSSTVFNAPCRAAVYESDRDLAKAKNKALEAKSLSEQSLNIKDKILEVDRFLLSSTGASIELIEAHPELCFKYLNGNIVQSKKSQISGIEERLRILEQYDADITPFYEKVLKETLRKNVKRDDIVDALCLCLTNKLGITEKTTFLKDKNTFDSKNLPIKLGYYIP